MAYLINRSAPGRIQCLHALCKLIENKYKTTTTFKMRDIMFDSTIINIHSFCDLLIKGTSLTPDYCRYLENPLSKSGCGLTKSLDDNTTNSKEISDTVNVLHGLGFIDRNDHDLTLTLAGSEFALTSYKSNEMLPIIRNSVLKYGPFVGMLFQIIETKKDIFNTNDIDIGYPDAKEKILSKGSMIALSSGSKDDPKTRTKSCLLAWATTAGFIYPNSLVFSIDKNKPHISSSDYILGESRNLKSYKIIEIPSKLTDGKFITERPLDYNNFTKKASSLREYGQKETRDLTMKHDSKIKNRRFAILYNLNKCFHSNKNLSINKLVEFMINHDEHFVIEKKNLLNTICKEIEIAFTAGIPYSLKNNLELKPHTGLNIEELTKNAPPDILHIVESFEL
ncbi:MAG: hypothetical protein WCJ72_20475 [Chryseobacterium sp.]